MYHSIQFTKIQNSVLSTHQRPLCNLNFPQKYVVRMLKMISKILVLNVLFPNLYLPPHSQSQAICNGWCHWHFYTHQNTLQKSETLANTPRVYLCYQSVFSLKIETLKSIYDLTNS